MRGCPKILKWLDGITENSPLLLGFFFSFFQHYNSHLESTSSGSPDTGAVYRALPVYRVGTWAQSISGEHAQSKSSSGYQRCFYNL